MDGTGLAWEPVTWEPNWTGLAGLAGWAGLVLGPGRELEPLGKLSADVASDFFFFLSSFPAASSGWLASNCWLVLPVRVEPQSDQLKFTYYSGRYVDMPGGWKR